MLNIHDFGGKGDNTTDNLAAINKAIAAATASPTADCAIYFPAGKYLVSGPVNIPRGLRLTGVGLLEEGELGSILVANYNETNPDAGFLNFTPTVPYLGTGNVIDGLALYKGVNKTGGTGITFFGGADATRRPGRNVIRDCIIGAYLYSGTTAWWHRNLLLDGVAQAVSGTQGLRDTYLTNVEMCSATVNNIELRNALHFYATGLQVYAGSANGNPGILVTGTGSPCTQSEDVHFSGCSCWGNITFDWATFFTYRGYGSKLTVTGNATRGLLDIVGLSTVPAMPKTVQLRSG